MRRRTLRQAALGGTAALFLALPGAALAEESGQAAPASPGASPGGGAGSAPARAATPGAPGGFAPLTPGIAPLTPESQARVGGLGFPFTGLGRATAPGPGLSLTPSIALEQIYNDNIFFTARNRREDLITRVTPGLLLNADTARLSGVLNYAPNLDYYWRNTDQNRIGHQGSLQLLGTVVPDRLFIDVRGAAAVQSLSGGQAPEAQSSVGRDDQVQTLSFSVSPYLVQRFGGLATARLGYVYQYVDQDRVDQNAPRPVGQLPNSFTPSQFSSHQGYLVVRSGEDFGRLAMQGTLSGTTFEGGGIYEGAYKNIGLVETRYSITRTIAALVELGYETQKFNTVPATDISDVVWAVGTRLTPSEDSSIIAKYGQRDGFTSFFLDGALALGVRTRVSANYSERLTSSALQAGDLLSTVTLDPLGNPVDALTGVPVLPSFASSFLSVQSGLFREKAASLAISQIYPRDTLRLSVSQTERTPVADAPGQQQRGFSQEGISFSLTWSRALAETTQLTAFGQYGTSSSGANSGDTTTYSAGLALVQQLGTGLAGTLSYRLGIRDGGSTTTAGGAATGDDGRAVQNIITAGIRQTF